MQTDKRLKESHLKNGKWNIVFDVTVRRDDGDGHRDDLGDEPELFAGSGRVEFHAHAVQPKCAYLLRYTSVYSCN